MYMGVRRVLGGGFYSTKYILITFPTTSVRSHWHIAKMLRYCRSDGRSPKDLLTRGAYIYSRARQKTFIVTKR